MFFNADSISRLRAVAERSMNDICTITKQTPVRGQYGENTHGVEVVATDVPCRLIPAGEATTTGAMESGSRETLEEEYQLAVPYDTILAADYKVIVNDVTYLVLRVQQAVTDSVMVQALVVRDNG